MIPTLIGIVTFAIGLLILVGRGTPSMLIFLIMTSLMGGAAALVLPALGGSTVPPMQVAIGFLIVRVLIPGGGQIDNVGASLRANIALILFVLYGVVMAYVGPRLFAHQINVVPLRIVHLDFLLATFPLEPSARNTTTAIYMIGTMLTAIGVFVAARDPRTPLAFVRGAVVLAWINIFFGLFGAAVRNQPLAWTIDFFRNGNYAQTDQYFSGYARISGLMPEPSAFALFTFSWFVFLVEAWWRDVCPRWTGPAALASGAILMLSTSATAYAGLAGYAAILGVRLILFPQALTIRKALSFGALLIAATIVGCVVVAAAPAILRDFTNMIADMTLAKRTSQSGIQRAFWAYKGIEAFRVSSGLGIGPGSFRSSSIITAIIGSTGVIGSALFAFYLAQILKPLRRSTYLRVATFEEGVGVAAAWAAFMTIVPSAILLAVPDPGATFAIFVGIAMGLRVQGFATRPRAYPASPAAARQSAQ